LRSRWQRGYEYVVDPRTSAKIITCVLCILSVNHYLGRGACTTSHPDVNTFDMPRPSAILNYIDFGAHVLKPFIAESWGPDYVLCQALTSWYNVFLGSRIRIASDARLSLHNYEVLRRRSSGRSAHLMPIIWMSS